MKRVFLQQDCSDNPVLSILRKKHFHCNCSSE